MAMINANKLYKIFHRALPIICNDDPFIKILDSLISINNIFKESGHGFVREIRSNAQALG